MSTTPKHEENRLKICAPCGKKIVFGKNKQQFVITDKLESVIKKRLNNSFQKSNSQFPLGICGTCRIILSEYERKIEKRTLPSMLNYESMHLLRSTRASNECDCYICVTAQKTSHTKVKKGRGKKRDLSQIDVEKKQNDNLDSTQVANNVINKKSSMHLCSSCFQEIGKGIQHVCNIGSKARDNVLKIVNTLSSTQQEQLVSNILKQTFDSCADNRNDIPMKLSTQGGKLSVVIKPTEKKDVFFSQESLDNFQSNTKTSNNHMNKVVNLLRSNAGRKSVPCHYQKHVSENSKVLEDFYSDAIHQFDISDSKSKQNRPVVWADAENLLEYIVEERNLVNDFTVKVMLDGGQNFFKICMTVMPKNYSPEKEKTSRYAEGGSSAKKAKLTSVGRLILLCVVPDIKETYENIQLLFNLTNINNISFKLVCDFKVLLIINGQQTAMSTYPCPYCFVSLNDLKKTQENNLFDQTHENSDNSSDEADENADLPDSLKVSDNCLKLKTFGDLKNDNKEFIVLGKKKLAMYAHSTINAPLLEEDDNTYVIEKCVIPELHILQGFVNHLFWDGIVPLVGEEKALNWPKKLGLVSKNYHGRVFEGNACRKLLKSSDALQNPDMYSESVGYFDLVPYVSAFKAMDKIVASSFSTGEINSNIDNQLLELRKAVESTEVSTTLKIHILLEHLQNCLYFLDGKGLGLWSEQAGESVHSEFLKIWNKHKINYVNDVSYSKRLKRAVVEFSSFHI